LQLLPLVIGCGICGCCKTVDDCCDLALVHGNCTGCFLDDEELPALVVAWYLLGTEFFSRFMSRFERPQLKFLLGILLLVF
jgi:hypothetical protein